MKRVTERERKEREEGGGRGKNERVSERERERGQRRAIDREGENDTIPECRKLKGTSLYVKIFEYHTLPR